MRAYERRSDELADSFSEHGERDFLAVGLAPEERLGKLRRLIQGDLGRKRRIEGPAAVSPMRARFPQVTCRLGACAKRRVEGTENASAPRERVQRASAGSSRGGERFTR